MDSSTTKPDIPGTTLFDGAMARKGYALNKMCYSFNRAANRDAFVRDEDAYCAKFALTPAQRDAVNPARGGIAQRQRHVEVDHHGRAARRGARLFGRHAQHGYRRIFRQVDPHRSAGQRRFLRECGLRQREACERQPCDRELQAHAIPHKPC